MCLHLLPKDKIERSFLELKIASLDIKEEINKTLVERLMDYIDHTCWIQGAIWSPEFWSVFMQQVIIFTYNYYQAIIIAFYNQFY